jgi:hypothetical protein
LPLIEGCDRTQGVDDAEKVGSLQKFSEIQRKGTCLFTTIIVGKDLKIPRFKDSRIQGFQNFKISRFQDSGIQGFQDSKIQDSRFKNWVYSENAVLGYSC